jgi:ankyrin repeat protein
MTTLYQNLLNFQSNSGPAKAVDGRGRRSSISLPVTACAQYIGRLTQKKKPKRSVKFPMSVVMQQAIMDGDVQEVKQILEERGSCVANQREPGGLYPAMRCVFESQLDALKVLVEAGADLSAHDDEEWTVLHVASCMDDLDAARFVLNQCKRNLTHVRNVDGERPIDLAESADMARLLLEADLRSRETAATTDGESAILALVRDHHSKNGDCQALDEAMQSGTSYDSLLHLAAGKNYPRLAAYLLQSKISQLEARDKKGRTSLHTAAYFNSIDIVLLLVQSGASTHSLTNSYEKASDLTTHGLIHSILQEEYL